MLAADAHLHARARAAATFHCNLDELSDTLLVKAHERVLLHDALGLVLWQECPCIVPAQAISGLREVIGAETEELSLLRQAASLQSCSGQLHHGADAVGEVHPLLLLNFTGGLLNHRLELHQLFQGRHQRHHDLSHRCGLRSAADLRRSFEDGACLHLADLRVGDGQAAAAVPKHWVGLLQLRGTSADSIQWHTCCFCNQTHLGLGVRDEFVQRWVQQAHGHGQAVHDAEELRDVFPLHCQQLQQCSLPVGFVCCQNHLPHGHDAATLEKHVFRANQADALRSKLLGLAGICGRLCISPHLHGAELVSPGHDRAETTGQLWRHSWDFTQHHLPGDPVDGDDLTLTNHHLAHLEQGRTVVDLHFTCSRHARAAHATCHHGSMARHASACGQNTLCRMKTVDVIWTGLDAHKDHLLAVL
mmetsp:Transcript_14155/g.33606  ORF Transcript_14155/g.33606 Transcript_14155/m.33606 type:complete len:417 (-) Transcript_14155:1009-2259(-)